jgi:hypothetical protein
VTRTGKLREGRDPTFEKIPLSAIWRVLVRNTKFSPRLINATESLEKITSGYMEWVITIELESLDKIECDGWSVHLCNCYAAVEGNDRRRRNDKELIVKLEYLSPIRCITSYRITVHRIDRRLQLV